MLILSLFVLRALSGSFCFDIELEGSLKLGNQFINALKQPKVLANIVRRYLSPDILGKGKLPTAIDPMGILMRAANAYHTTTEQIDINNPDPLEKLMNHLQEKGTLTLNNIGTKILTDLKIKKNITSMLEIITKDYGVKMQNYYDFVQKSQNDSEKEFMYLDMVETSCMLLFNEEKKLLNDIIMHENEKTFGSFKNMTDKLLELSYKDKQEAMKYICDNYDVCRQYPAFTDYCANLMSEVIELEDYKFRAVLDILIKILKQNEKIFARISEKEDRILIMEKLQEISTDLLEARERLAVAKSVLTQRFKTIISPDAEFKMRSKAMRIILDIVDKALTTEDDVFAIDFDNSVQVIRRWSGLGNEMNKNLEEFARSILRKLQHNLTKNARKEIKVLIKTLMRGNTEDDELYQHLFKFGSKYVKNEDFHSLDIKGI